MATRRRRPVRRKKSRSGLYIALGLLVLVLAGGGIVVGILMSKAADSKRRMLDGVFLSAVGKGLYFQTDHVDELFEGTGPQRFSSPLSPDNLADGTGNTEAIYKHGGYWFTYRGVRARVGWDADRVYGFTRVFDESQEGRNVLFLDARVIWHTHAEFAALLEMENEARAQLELPPIVVDDAP